MSVRPATPKQERFRLDLLDLLKKYTGELPAKEMLAVSSYLVGQIVALQDKRKLPPDGALDIVAQNIRIGNEHACAAIRAGKEAL